jgi:hypothetical protein
MDFSFCKKKASGIYIHVVSLLNIMQKYNIILYRTGSYRKSAPPFKGQPSQASLPSVTQTAASNFEEPVWLLPAGGLPLAVSSPLPFYIVIVP